jgi:hypothetical protein
MRRDACLRAWGSILFAALAFGIFSTDRFPPAFLDTDHPGLDSFFRRVGHARLFLDGARPHFIQDAAPDAVLFYDLNTRLASPQDCTAQLCMIAACFGPDYWVITDHQKSPQAFAALKQQFTGVVASTDPHAFVATGLATDCPPRTAAVCAHLTMRK